MGRFRLALCTLVILLASIQPTDAQIKLPELFSSHMVLLRKAQVAVWGHASANGDVSINASWMERKVDKNGHWSTKLTATDTREP